MGSVIWQFLCVLYKVHTIVCEVISYVVGYYSFLSLAVIITCFSSWGK